MAEDRHRSINGQLTAAPANKDTRSPQDQGGSHTQSSPLARSNQDSLDRGDGRQRSPGNLLGISSSPYTFDPSARLSPEASDRVFPIRSYVSRDTVAASAHPSDCNEHHTFPGGGGRGASARRLSVTSPSVEQPRFQTAFRKSFADQSVSSSTNTPTQSRKGSAGPDFRAERPSVQEHLFKDNASINTENSVDDAPRSVRSTGSAGRGAPDDSGGYLTARFKHVVTDGGHAVITGRDGDTLQRCEDEPIHIPGAVQGFGLLIALEEMGEGKLLVRVVSENSKRMIGYTPKQLFALESFTDILSEEQTDNLLDHIDFIRDDEADVETSGPEVFTISIKEPGCRRSTKMWCAIHINDAHSQLIICEFELEDDILFPLVPPGNATPEPPEDTLNSDPTAEELADSTQNISRPLRVLRGARKRKGEAAAMEVFNIMSQVQEQLAAAPSLEQFLRVLVGVIKELTGFHRVMIYQFDATWNGRVVTELVDPRATKDLYKGLNFPASDIPKQARDLYKVNKVRLLYDREQETARLVCRTVEDLERPLDLTHSYLRAMSPIHIKYLTNMAVRASMSISINAFDELWGLISCHGYGSKGMRVSFPIRKMCRLIGDSACQNIERLSYASRLQARKLINTAPTEQNPSGYIIASSDDLLKLFSADFGLLSIRDETKILGELEQTQEALAMLEYLRMRKMTSVFTSADIRGDFPDLRYPPGFQTIAGLLLVPLAVGGNDFIVFFRKGQLKEVKWAGNPYEKYVKEGTEGYLEPRKSFKVWSETVVGKCREWTEEEIDTAAVLCLVYGKFIEVWRQKEQALQNSQLTRLLLANSAHEVRTPLNAIINYLEIALEGQLDQETRENLSRSHSASKSLIYVINDLLDLTKTVEGTELIKGEAFELKPTLREATNPFAGDAKRKSIEYAVREHPGLPHTVIGDQRRVRQAIANVTANAIENTFKGSVTVEMYLTSRTEGHAEIEVVVTDTGVGMNGKQLDALFCELEEVQSENDSMLEDAIAPSAKRLEDVNGQGKKRTLGLGLAVVARIVRNMNGQLRLKSEEGKGSRFAICMPFDLPESDTSQAATGAVQGPSVPQAEELASTEITKEEVMLVEKSTPRRDSVGTERGLSRRHSVESMNSRKSVKSLKSYKSMQSNKSGASNKSDVDRLIEDIQSPPMGKSANLHDRNASRPSTSRKSSQSTPTMASGRVRSRSVDHSPNQIPEHRRSMTVKMAGRQEMADSKTPIRPVKVPEDESATPDVQRTASQVIEEIPEDPDKDLEPLNAQHMHILVAEDDPMNSKIVKKRLEKSGHEVCLTVNGEECASAYGERSAHFDAILMDMQMPIVDGLTSTKMIRSFEKSHPRHMLSRRARLNGRVPIFAVSASLLEREKQMYVDAGFDGWILKPVNFARMNELLLAIVDEKVRQDNVYKSGSDWERGGWFHKGQSGLYAADTTPSQRIPKSKPSRQMRREAHSDDPFVGDASTGRQGEEQERLERGDHARSKEAASQDEESVGSTTPTLGAQGRSSEQR